MQLWRLKAHCRDLDPAIFFPDGKGGRPYSDKDRERRNREAQQRRVIQKYCSQCEVVSECLEYAIETGINHGVAGGKTEQERKVLIKRRVVA